MELYEMCKVNIYISGNEAFLEQPSSGTITAK